MRRGGRGRGNGHRLNLAQLKAWRASCKTSGETQDEIADQLRRLAVLSDNTSLLADVIEEVLADSAWKFGPGLSKLALSQALTYLWHRFALKQSDALGDKVPIETPAAIKLAERAKWERHLH